MFQPWNQDARPIWRVRATWVTPQPVAVEDHGLLLETLTETGHVRSPSLDVRPHRTTLTMFVRAYRREAAEHAASRITAVACKLSGLEQLGVAMVRAARPNPVR
jgi:hypothetical protein